MERGKSQTRVSNESMPPKEKLKSGIETNETPNPDPEMTDDYRPAIVNALTALQKKELALKQTFKARAYRTVIQQILHLDHPVTRMDDLAGIRGIGDAIQIKLREIFATGHLQAADAAEEKYSLALRDDLQKIYGVGPAFATKLIEEHGVQSVEHLRQMVAAKPALLTKNQQVGLRYYEDFQARIPREEMDRHVALLHSAIAEVEMDIVGSYRRGAATSGDIDVLLKDSLDAPADLNAFVKALQASGYLLDILALGPHKCMGVCRLSPDLPARRIDLLVTPAEEYPYALLYFTGSDRFNVAMRQHALQRGITMNEHGMQSVQSILVGGGGDASPAKQITCERDIFHALGLTYVAPERRVDHQQIRPLRSKPIFIE